MCAICLGRDNLTVKTPLQVKILDSKGTGVKIFKCVQFDVEAIVQKNVRNQLSFTVTCEDFGLLLLN